MLLIALLHNPDLALLHKLDLALLHNLEVTQSNVSLAYFISDY